MTVGRIAVPAVASLTGKSRDDVVRVLDAVCAAFAYTVSRAKTSDLEVPRLGTLRYNGCVRRCGPPCVRRSARECPESTRRRRMLQCSCTVLQRLAAQRVRCADVALRLRLCAKVIVLLHRCCIVSPCTSPLPANDRHLVYARDRPTAKVLTTFVPDLFKVVSQSLCARISTHNVKSRHVTSRHITSRHLACCDCCAAANRAVVAVDGADVIQARA